MGSSLGLARLGSPRCDETVCVRSLCRVEERYGDAQKALHVLESLLKKRRSKEMTTTGGQAREADLAKGC